MASKRIKGITIEIGGDATKLTKALQDVDKQVNKSKSSLKDINNLLKVDPKNVELLTQKEKELNEAIKGTEEKLKKEQEALEKMGSKIGPMTKEQVDQYEALQREIIDTKNNLDSLEQEYKEFGSVAAQQTKAAAEEMQAAGKKIQAAGQSITSAGKTMTTYVTAPIVAAGTAAVKTAADFEAGMSKVQAISGASGEEMEALTAKAREMGSKTKFSASESAEALSYMAMAGWKAEEMLSGLEGIMHLAAASGEELGTTSDIVTDALTAFGLTAQDSARFADILAAAATNSNTNVSMLGESFKYAAAPAGTLGYSAEDVALALGLMANNGIKADMAGTSLRNLFNRMAKPTKESQEAINQLGLSLYDSQGKMYSFREVMKQIRGGFKNCKMTAEEFDAAIEDLDNQLADGTLTQKKYDDAVEDLTRNAFGAEEAEKARAAAMLGGTRAMSGLLAIANASEEDFNKLAAAIDNSSQSYAKLADGSIVPLEEALASGQKVIEQYNGEAEKMAAVMEDNLSGDITKLKSDLQELAISFGNLLIPEIRETVQSLKELVDKVNAMDDSQKQAVLTIAKILAAIGPLLIVIGSIITAIGKVVWAVGQVKAATAAGGVLAPLAAKISAAWASITGAVSGAAATVSGALEGIAGVVGATVGALAAAVALVIAAVVVLHKNGEAVAEATFLLFERIQEHLENLKNFISEKLALIKEAYIITGYLIAEKASEIWESIKNAITEKAEAAVNGVKNFFTNLREFFQELIRSAYSWGSDLMDNIKKGITDKIDGIKQAAANVGNTIKSYLHFSVPDRGPLADFNSWMPDMMSQMAQQINAGIPGVTAAMQNATGAMRDSIDYSGQLAGINNSLGQLAGAGGIGGDITIPVYIGNQKFAQAVASADQLNKYRSGGR